MSLEKNKKSRINIDLWKWIAIISGAFALLVCFLLIANYAQINRLDPINTEAINTLVQRLSDNPNDEALRDEIRALDLLVRKAYFTNQWQVKTGGYLVLISIALMLIAIQIINSAKTINPVIGETNGEIDQILKKRSRHWISIGGIGIVIIALVLAFFTHEKLENTFTKAAIAAATTEPEEPETKTINKTSVAEKAKEKKAVEVKAETQDEPKTEIVEPESKQTKEEKVTPKKEAAVATTTPAFTLNARKHFPSFRGAGGLGIAYQKDIPVQWDEASNQNILWKVKLDNDGYNSPIIWGNKLFLTGANASKKEIFCYNKNSGKLIWSKVIRGIPGSPATNPDVTEDTGLAAPTAATDGKKVFAIFANGDIVALDMNGNQVWAKNLGVPRNHYGHSSSLLVYENKLIVQYDHGSSAKIMALLTETGEELWSTPRKVRISWASPVIVHRGDQTEVIVAADPNIAGYDINTGKELWKIDCISGEVGPSIAYANGLVFGLNEYASLVAISGGNQPQILWEDYDYLSDVPSPVAINDLLFVVTSYGMVVCHNAQTGEKYWEHEFNNGFYASPILVEDRIYLIDRKGIMHIFKAQKTFELISEPTIKEKVVSTPAFADGQIFIRAEEHLYGIGKAN